jgi:hypothetical protein
MRIRMAENVGSSGKLILFGKAKEKRRFGKHRYEGEDNIQTDRKEI